MRIGLSGVPGSGKSDLAQAIKKHFDNLQSDKKTIVIDDYVEDVKENTFLALGFDAAYVGNIEIALERAARERIAYEKDNYDNIVSCGTIFETASYMAQSLDVDYQFIRSEEDKYDFLRRSDAAMKIFACFYIDLVKYDYIFHLSPLKVDKDERIGQLEFNLQSAFDSFKLVNSIPILINGETKEEILENRLNQVLGAINADNTEEQDVQTQEPN
jgi:hypothetical protein